MITTARALAFALPALALALTACGSEPEQPGKNADEFAARIGAGEASPAPAEAPVASGAAPAPAVPQPPRIEKPLPGAAPGPFARGTLTDPASKICGAPLMGPFIGKLADQNTRAAIANTLGRTDNLRFVAFGSVPNVTPDPTNPRLSIMLDAQNIIRDARCG